MQFVDIITLAVILLVVGAAALYIVKEKKKGKKCIGCPYAESCGSARNSSCEHCNSEDNRDA